MRVFRIPILLSVLLFAAACTTWESARRLDAVESYINERPDSALSVLHGMDTTALRTRAQKARYSLLRTMAMDKCYQEISQEQLRPAIAWYARHGTPDEKLKVYYYQGCIAQRKKDRNAAAVYFTRAEEFAGQIRDKHALGLLYLAEATLYDAVHNSQKAKEYTEKGYELYVETDDPLKEAVLGQLAIAYLDLKEWDYADSLFHRGLSAAGSNNHVLSVFLSNYAHLKVLQPDPDPQAALALFNRKVSELGYPLSLQDVGAYAYALILSGREDEAKGFLEHLESQKENFPLQTGAWLSACAQASGDYLCAYEELRRTHVAEEAIIQEILTDSVTGAISEYREKEAEHNRMQYRLRIALFSVIVLLLSLVMALIFLRKSKLEAELDRMLRIYAELERDAAVQDERALEIGRQLDHFRYLALQERNLRFRQAGQLRTALWRVEHLGVPALVKADPTMSVIKKELTHIYDIEGSGENLLRRFDDELDGLLSPLRGFLNLRSDEDHLFLCCCLLDLPTDVVATRLGITTNHVRVKKHRLKEQIARLNNPEYDALFGIKRKASSIHEGN